MRRAFTLLEVLLALALTALAATGATAVLVPLLSDAPSIAADIEARSKSASVLDQISCDLLIEHESMPRRRVEVGPGWLQLITRTEGRTVTIRYDAGSLLVDTFEAELRDTDRRLLVRVGDRGAMIEREYRVP